LIFSHASTILSPTGVPPEHGSQSTVHLTRGSGPYIGSCPIWQAKNSCTIPGIGKLVLVNRKARMGRNPQTSKAIHIPAKRIVSFRISKQAKDTIISGQ
jgi:hypothetical protein